MSLATCPYNPKHKMKASRLEYHVQTCPDRNGKELNGYENGLLRGYVISPLAKPSEDTDRQIREFITGQRTNPRTEQHNYDYNPSYEDKREIVGVKKKKRKGVVREIADEIKGNPREDFDEQFNLDDEREEFTQSLNIQNKQSSDSNFIETRGFNESIGKDFIFNRNNNYDPNEEDRKISENQNSLSVIQNDLSINQNSLSVNRNGLSSLLN